MKNTKAYFGFMVALVSILSVFVSASHGPDLKVESVEFLEFGQEQGYFLRIMILNDGLVDPTNDVTEPFEIVVESMQGTSKVTESLVLDHVSAGGSASFDMFIPHDLNKNQDVKVRVTVDVENVISEKDETNNVLEKVLVLPKPDFDNDGVADGVDNCYSTPNPDQKDSDNDGVGDVCDNPQFPMSVDLTVQSVDVSSVIATGIVTKTVVKNNGDITINGAFNLNVAAMTKDGTVVSKDVTIFGLQKGQTQTVELTLEMDTQGMQKTIVRAAVDSENAISESNEKNNLFEKEFVFQIVPKDVDLEINGFGIKTLAQESITFSVIVANGGEEDITTPFVVSVKTIDNNGKMAEGKVTVDELDAEEDEKVLVTVSGIDVEGSSKILAEATVDAGNAVLEKNENNNKLQIEIEFAVLPPSPSNTVPVLAPIGNKEVVQGSTLSFKISATDADGDVLTYSAQNLPQGATFDSATQTFAWTPAETVQGTFSVTFLAADDTAAATETIQITVKQKASSLETQYNDLQKKYDEYYEEYKDLKDDYEDAVDDNDASDIKKFKEDLEDLQDKVDDLEEDVDDLTNDVEDSSDSKKKELLDKLEDLSDDVQNLQDKIDTVLGKKKTDYGVLGSTGFVPVPVPPAGSGATDDNVEVQKLSFAPGAISGQATATQPAKASSWEETRYTLLLAGGIVVLLALVIFLLALLLGRK